jgi:hypothetical protein
LPAMVLILVLPAAGFAVRVVFAMMVHPLLVFWSHSKRNRGDESSGSGSLAAGQLLCF